MPSINNSVNCVQISKSLQKYFIKLAFYDQTCSLPVKEDVAIFTTSVYSQVSVDSLWFTFKLDFSFANN